MAVEQYFQESYAHHEMVDGDGPSVPKWKSFAAAEITSNNTSGCFDCNICLDDARDPVVTLCGHLYCWPCIYKWLHFQSTSADSEQKLQCPVCKANVSQTMLVPLYGRGQSSLETEPNNKLATLGVKIPRRPPATIFRQQLHGSSIQAQVQSDRQQQYEPQNYSNYASAAAAASVASPMFNLGEMVYARVFGNSSEVGLYAYPNSYHLMSNSSPRRRRQEIKVEKSLNRVSIFLFCFVVFCLLMF